VNIAISKAHFNSTALGQIIEPICARGTGIVLGGILGGNSVFMLLSVTLGQIATIITICRLVLKDVFWKWRSYFVATLHPMTTLRRYTDFIWFNTASQQINPVLLLGIQISITSVFSAEFAGHYILAVSILSLPATMIALATAPVVYRHLIEMERTAPLKLLPHLLIAISCYLVIGFMILLPIFLFGEEIFRFAFGKAWGHAGTLAEIMSIAYVGAFAAIGVQSIFGITRRLKMHFILEVFSSLVVLCVIIFCFKTLDFDGAIRYLAIALFLRNMVLISGCIIVAFQYQKGISVISK
jgi:O-antigen/teichoic acid export membrane protein